jgi:hypothetical protein
VEILLQVMDRMKQELKKLKERKEERHWINYLE